MIFLIIILFIWALTASIAFLISIRKVFELMEYQQEIVFKLKDILKASQIFFNFSNTVEYMPEVIAWENFVKEVYKSIKEELERVGIPTEEPQVDNQGD